MSNEERIPGIPGTVYLIDNWRNSGDSLLN